MNKTLSLINYLTGEKIERQELYTPSALVYSNGKLYVGFGDQQCIGIYDTETLQLKDQIFTYYDFGDIAVGNDGFIYTSPICLADIHSRYVKSFSSISKQEVSNYSTDHYGYKLSVNPVDNIIYIESSSFTYENGMISASKYGIDNEMTLGKNKVSPDGKYVFNTSSYADGFTDGRIVYKSSSNVYTNDLKFYHELNKPFNDVAFDIENNRFYTAIEGKFIYSYEYSTLSEIDIITTKENVKELYYYDNKLILICQLASGEYVIDKLDVNPDITPTPIPTPSADVTPLPTVLQWNCNITDSVFDPKKPYVYFIDSSINLLVSYNYETNALNFKQQDSLNCIDILGDEILVGYGSQSMIGIYDTNNLEMKAQIKTEKPFTDLAVGRDGYIYVLESDVIKSYSRSSKQEISSISCGNSMYTTSTRYIQMHSTQNLFYLSDTSSDTMSLFQYNNGIMGYKKCYDGDSSSYQTGNINRISPDGCFVFNEKGTVFESSLTNEYNLSYVTNLSEGGFSDLCINLNNNRIYAASKATPVVVVYNYSTKKLLGVINTKYVLSSISLRNGNLVALSNQKVEIIPEDNITILPQISPTPVSITPTKIPASSTRIILPEYSVIKDVVSHPTNPYIYSIDSVSRKVILTNTKTGEIIEASVTGTPECIDYHNDELYIGFGAQKNILIYDAYTLEYKDCIMTEFTFGNFKIGNDGHVYTSPVRDLLDEGYISCYSRISKQEISGIRTYMSGYFAKNSISNLMYYTDFSFYALHSYYYENGQFISSNFTNTGVSYGTNNIVSADGKYVINENGIVLSSSSDKTKDLIYVTKIPSSGIKDIAFDISKNRFYVVNGSDTVAVYDYRTFTKITTILLNGNADRIFYNDSMLFTLSKDNGERYYYETVDTEHNTIPNDVTIPDYLIKQPSNDSVSVSWTTTSPYICMVEYGTEPLLDQKSNWESTASNDHAFILENLRRNCKYYMRIHYIINDKEVVSDVRYFITSDDKYFDFGSVIDKIVYDSLNNKAYGVSKESMKLFVIDLNKHQIENTILLEEKPSDLCLSNDSKRLYLLNCFGTFSIFDTEKQVKLEDIPCKLPSYAGDNVHYHIYFNNNKLYLVDGQLAPGLWVFDIKNRQLLDYSSTIKGIGDLVFSSSGKEFYYWYQKSWSKNLDSSNIYKCQIGELGNIDVIKKLHNENFGNNTYLRIDDSPILLDEENNKLYCKDIVLDTNKFEIVKEFSESINAIAPGKKRIAGTSHIFKTSDLLASSVLPISFFKNDFFDNSGNLYMITNGGSRIFYYREVPEVCDITTIDGDSSITVPVNGTLEAQYNAVGKDQFDVEIPNTSVIWSVYNPDSKATDLSISDAGVLKVDNNTVPGNYTISAVAKSNENIKNTIQLVIKPSIHEVEIVGDFNGDKAVNSIDFAVFRKYLLGIVDSFEVKDEMYVGDLNRDGKINAVDFAILRGYLLGKFDELPYLKT